MTPVADPGYAAGVLLPRWSSALRLATVLALAAAAAASASSTGSRPGTTAPTPAPPPPQGMNITSALGLWKSSFGAVKIEEDDRRGPNSGYVQGVWMYQRSGADVVGYFAGMLNGNVLQFTWQEPNVPAPLVGQGYLVFDPGGARFAGRWWTNSRDRAGEWNGWRHTAAPQPLPTAPTEPTPQPTAGADYPPPGY